MTDKEIVEKAKEAEKRTSFGELVHSPISKGVNSAFGIGFIEGMVEYRDSLQEEPASKDLESAAIVYNKKVNFVVTGKIPNEHFIAGAKWQKEQDQSAIELAEDHAMLAGMEKMKENMMANAIDAELYSDGMLTPIIKVNDKEKISDIKFGDKVKIIIIKNE